ncbi:MAG: hypothetical protein GY928_13285 [Colwellia sp.]|nr:hypothetical protein [Colwellia sp.]
MSHNMLSPLPGWYLCLDIRYDLWHDEFWVDLFALQRESESESDNDNDNDNRNDNDNDNDNVNDKREMDCSDNDNDNVNDKREMDGNDNHNDKSIPNGNGSAITKDSDNADFTFVFEGQFTLPYNNLAAAVSHAMLDCTHDLFDKMRFTKKITSDTYLFRCSQVLTCNGGQHCGWSEAASQLIQATKWLHSTNQSLRVELHAIYKWGKKRKEEAMYWDLRNGGLSEKLSLAMWNKYVNWTGLQAVLFSVQTHSKNTSWKDSIIQYLTQKDALQEYAVNIVFRICKAKEIQLQFLMPALEWCGAAL